MRRRHEEMKVAARLVREVGGETEAFYAGLQAKIAKPLR